MGKDHGELHRYPGAGATKNKNQMQEPSSTLPWNPTHLQTARMSVAPIGAN